ncbi:hypothetical protein FOS14_07555 [Skermania sp. ID1734]|uniref:hypothetical protein n=1 Tax=Skermania sp. ID1734 TaxID=2597516 RepID=UPI00117C80AB|nr:hypothetical protein [Skermania sp. ID1734]TSE00277.1 hypothetical protein FOS14_07555 [Skermania sp. ID1734]
MPSRPHVPDDDVLVTGHDALAAELGAAPPAGLADLPDAYAQRLADTLATARKSQAAELAAATTEALRHVPRPLRGTVRKVVGL